MAPSSVLPHLGPRKPTPLSKNFHSKSPINDGGGSWTTMMTKRMRTYEECGQASWTRLSRHWCPTCGHHLAAPRIATSSGALAAPGEGTPLFRHAKEGQFGNTEAVAADHDVGTLHSRSVAPKVFDGPRKRRMVCTAFSQSSAKGTPNRRDNASLRDPG